MRITEIAFTVLPVTSIAAARAFYEGTLGLHPSSTWINGDMGMVEYSIGGGTLAIGAGAPLFKPCPDGGAVALEVDDYPAAVERLKAAGVRFAMETYETRVCFMSVVTDPDGNYLMLHKRKAT